MRKIFSLALIALAMIVVSCGKKDDEDKVTPNKLVGTWYLESLKFDGQAQTLTDCDKRSNITFRETEYSIMNYKLKNSTVALFLSLLKKILIIFIYYLKNNILKIAI